MHLSAGKENGRTYTGTDGTRTFRHGYGILHDQRVRHGYRHEGKSPCRPVRHERFHRASTQRPSLHHPLRTVHARLVQPRAGNVHPAQRPRRPGIDKEDAVF